MPLTIGHRKCINVIKLRRLPLQPWELNAQNVSRVKNISHFTDSLLRIIRVFVIENLFIPWLATKRLRIFQYRLLPKSAITYLPIQYILPFRCFYFHNCFWCVSWEIVGREKKRERNRLGYCLLCRWKGLESWGKRKHCRKLSGSWPWLYRFELAIFICSIELYASVTSHDIKRAFASLRAPRITTYRVENTHKYWCRLKISPPVKCTPEIARYQRFFKLTSILHLLISALGSIIRI